MIKEHDEIIIREMLIEDYNQLIELFKTTDGITVREADSYENTKKYLTSNPWLSFVAVLKSKIIGCSMAGYDGRREYLQHVLVKPEYRQKGIGGKLLQASINELKNIGISKTHLFVLKKNKIGNKFWKNRGWTEREDINTFSFNSSSNKNI